MDLALANKSIESKNTWDTPNLCVQVYDKPGVDEDKGPVGPTEIDLATWLPQEIDQNYHCGGKRSEDRRYWFGSKIKKITELITLLNHESCLKNGYSLVSAGTGGRGNNKRYYLRCEKHRKARQSKAVRNRTHSTKPIGDEQTCKMYIGVYFDEDHQEFYIRQNGGHSLSHCGHPPLRLEERKAAKRHAPDAAINDTQQLLSRDLDNKVIQEVINIKHGVKLNANAIKKMKEAILMDTTGKQMSIGEQLLHTLESDDDMIYVAYTGTLEQATSRVRVRKVTRKGKRARVLSKKKMKLESGDDIPVEVGSVDVGKEANDAEVGSVVFGKRDAGHAEDASELNDVSADAKSFVSNLITQLTTGDGTILLAVMWITKDGKKYHTKFPHVLGCDVTFGTNAEKRPLFRASGKTSDNKNIPHINAFLPSQQRWVFEWIFTDAIPTILDKNALRKTCMILTDQDNQLVGTLLFNLHLPGAVPIYGKALNRLCGWHKTDRGYGQFIKRYVNTERDEEFKNTMINWMNQLIKEVESEEQENDSYDKLMQYVDLAMGDETLSDGLVSNTKDWIEANFKPYLPLLCQWRYHAIYFGNVCENCFGESDNAAMKKDVVNKTKANNKLPTALRTNAGHTKARMNTLRTNAATSAASQLMPMDSHTELDGIRQRLSKHIVPTRRDLVVDQYDSASEYCFQVYEEGPTELVCLTRKVSKESTRKWGDRGPIPSYRLTRTVRLKEVRREMKKGVGVIIQCSCHLYTRIKGPCRHIYCIIKQPPIAEHFGFENHKLYELAYADDDEYTTQVDSYNAEVESYGGGLLLDTSLDELKKNNLKEEHINLDWYKQAMNNLGIDVNPLSKSLSSNKNCGDCSFAANEGGECHVAVSAGRLKNGEYGDNLGKLAEPKLQSYYTRGLPKYTELMNAVQNEEEYQEAAGVLDSLLAKLLGGKKKETQSADGSGEDSMGILSYPAIETRVTVPRKKPFFSPPSKTKR